LIGRSVLLWYASTCCAPPEDEGVGENLVADIKSYENVELIFSESTGALPPPHYRTGTFVILTDAEGNITAEHTLRDYEKVLERKDAAVSLDQLQNLLKIAAEKIAPKPEEERGSPCPGASSRSITIVHGDKVLLEASAYSCGGNFDYESFSDFSAEVERLF
jgi:hypothetical protein